ncbi:MAG: hypothetical protein HDR00_08035 [Lachnospiraceae bacterium]|nr:hypothetical protein [Lachnospiraceae bacterium]
MQKELKEVFDQVEMPETCVLDIEKAIEKRKGNISQGGKIRKIPRFAAAAAAIVMALLLTDGVVYAYTGNGLISRIIAFNGTIFTKTVNEEGTMTSEAELNLEEATAPAEYIDGRLYLTVNGENLDITDAISDTTAYNYVYADADSITHYIIIGGKPESFGYAEFLRDADEEWIGGSFVGGEVGGTINPDWLQNAKKELNIPWP